MFIIVLNFFFFSICVIDIVVLKEICVRWKVLVVAISKAKKLLVNYDLSIIYYITRIRFVITTNT